MAFKVLSVSDPPQLRRGGSIAGSGKFFRAVLLQDKIV
jgi:hypothetical protein